MEVTEVKVKVVPQGNHKLKAFATITLDDAFVVKDIRIIQGIKGMIVAMPAKKLTFRCHQCGFKNPLRSRFCGECGFRVRATSPRRNPATGRPVLQVDIAHPINPEARRMIEEKILQAYQNEFERVRRGIAQQVGEPVGAAEFEDLEDPDLAEAVPGSVASPDPGQGPRSEAGTLPPKAPSAAPPGPADSAGH
jgi:stage V sporulation protein G